MMQQTILVVGGSGMLGEPVVRCLQDTGFKVRVMVRNEDRARQLLGDSVEVIQGDVADQDRLRQAMDGCWGAHVSVGGPAEQVSAENVAALAPQLGVERVSYVSGSTVFEENRSFPMVAQKLEAEKAIRASGVPYTIFCPTWPMEQLPRFARGGKPFLIGKQPTPLHWFAADDLARMVSTAYQKDEAQNKRFFIHGPEALTMKDALERYCQAVYPDGEPVSVMPVWLSKLMATLTRNEGLKFGANLMAYFDRVGEMGDPSEANEILGAPAITLDSWLRSQKVVAQQAV